MEDYRGFGYERTYDYEASDLLDLDDDRFDDAWGDIDFSLNEPMSHFEYAHGHMNPATEDAYTDYLRRGKSKTKEKRGAEPTRESQAAHDWREKHALNAENERLRLRMEAAKSTRWPVSPRDIEEKPLGKREYLQITDMFIFKSKRYGLQRIPVRGLKPLFAPKRVFKRHHPLPVFRSMGGLTLKNNTKAEKTIITMVVDKEYVYWADGLPLNFDSLPAPSMEPFWNRTRDDVTYTWSVNRQERSRLMHALTGNIDLMIRDDLPHEFDAPPRNLLCGWACSLAAMVLLVYYMWFLSNLAINHAAHMTNGNIACFTCGGPHMAKNCPEKGAKGSAGHSESDCYQCQEALGDCPYATHLHRVGSKGEAPLTAGARRIAEKGKAAAGGDKKMFYCKETNCTNPEPHYHRKSRGNIQLDDDYASESDTWGTRDATPYPAADSDSEEDDEGVWGGAGPAPPILVSPLAIAQAAPSLTPTPTDESRALDESTAPPKKKKVKKSKADAKAAKKERKAMKRAADILVQTPQVEPALAGPPPIPPRPRARIEPNLDAIVPILGPAPIAPPLRIPLIDDEPAEYIALNDAPSILRNRPKNARLAVPQVHVAPAASITSVHDAPQSLRSIHLPPLAESAPKFGEKAYEYATAEVLLYHASIVKRGSSGVGETLSEAWDSIISFLSTEGDIAHGTSSKRKNKETAVIKSRVFGLFTINVKPNTKASNRPQDILADVYGYTASRKVTIYPEVVDYLRRSLAWEGRVLRGDGSFNEMYLSNLRTALGAPINLIAILDVDIMFSTILYAYTMRLVDFYERRCVAPDSAVTAVFSAQQARGRKRTKKAPVGAPDFQAAPPPARA
jgi:hypothetical protein